MTCIVGIIKNGKVHIGGDSAGVSGLNVVVRKDTKVFKRKGFLIGYTSSFRMGQLLRFKLNPPKYRQGEKDLYEYMCTDFVDSVRSCLKAGGYSQKKNEEESGGTFLVGYKGRLFSVQNDYQVGECVADYDSVGCGEDYAKGCLYALSSLPDYKDWSPYEIITLTLKAAENFSGGVIRPFNILSEGDE